MSGREQCQHLTCRHNLLGELAKLESKRAIRVMVARLEGRIHATCALDVADLGAIDDRECAAFFGMGAEAFSELVESSEKALRDAIEP